VWTALLWQVSFQGQKEELPVSFPFQGTTLECGIGIICTCTRM
jgi:hypothetical protein